MHIQTPEIAHTIKEITKVTQTSFLDEIHIQNPKVHRILKENDSARFHKKTNLILGQCTTKTLLK